MRPLRSLCLLVALASPSPVHASPPIGITSSPQCISLVAAHVGVPAQAAGQFTVTVHDLGGNPFAGAVVVIDLSIAPDLTLCADQLDPAATVDCVHKTVSKPTAADGTVQFTILGGSNGAGNAVTPLGGGRIYANGTLIQQPTVCAYDLDGSSGVGANDLSAWLTDFGTGQNYGRSDYDCSGNIGANDLSFWLTVFGSGAMTESCASHCP